MHSMDETEDGVAGGVAGAYASGTRYKIKIPPKGTSRFSVIDMATSAKGGRKGASVIRVDRAHSGPGMSHPIGGHFDHMHVEGIRVRGDPHIQISPGVAKATESTAKVLQKVNKVLLPVAIAVDTVHVGRGVYHDLKNETSRNTVEAAAGVAGGWGGGFGGAAGGAAIGSAICPGIGTLIGGVLGGIAGGIGGGIGAEKVVEEIGDACDYDLEERECKKCKRKFKNRKYKGEHYDLCPKCRPIRKTDSR